MIKHIIIALCLCAAVTPVRYSNSYDVEWAYDRLMGSVAAPFMWTTAGAGSLKIQVASPVNWVSNTVFPQYQEGVYKGGVNCNAGLSCTDTGKTETVIWSHKDKQAYTGKPAVVTTKFSWDNTDPTKNDAVFSAYLAEKDQSIALWPKHSGFDGKFTDYKLATVWGVGPENNYFEYLRKVYSTMKDTDIYFRYNLKLGEGEGIDKVLVKQAGKVLTASTFDMSIGEPLTDKDPKYQSFKNSEKVKGYWALDQGKVNINGHQLSTDDSYGVTCMSNYFHNSIIAVNDPVNFKKVWGEAVCLDGDYAKCRTQPFDPTKVPDLTVSIRTSGNAAYDVVIPVEDYVYYVKNKTTGLFDFKELLIGDLKNAINTGACPDSSTLALGNLFHLHNNVVFMQSAKTDAKTKKVTYSNTISFAGMTAEGRTVKTFVVWIGLLSVLAFFIAIMVCKSFSKPLEEVTDMPAPHGTIGNAEEGDYAKADDSA